MFPCPEDGVTSTSSVFSNPRLVFHRVWLRWPRLHMRVLFSAREGIPVPLRPSLLSNLSPAVPFAARTGAANSLPFRFEFIIKKVSQNAVRPLIHSLSYDRWVFCPAHRIFPRPKRRAWLWMTEREFPWTYCRLNYMTITHILGYFYYSTLIIQFIWAVDNWKIAIRLKPGNFCMGTAYFTQLQLYRKIR